MAKSFDFNALTQETLETKLPGPEGVTLHVTTPPERMIETLAASQEEINQLRGAEGRELEAVRKSYELAAALISCNTEGVTVTADDLRGKYNIAPAVLAVYLTSYMAFINDFHDAKN